MRIFLYPKLEEVAKKINEITWDENQNEQNRRALSDAQVRIERVAENLKIMEWFNVGAAIFVIMAVVAFSSGVLD